VPAEVGQAQRWAVGHPFARAWWPAWCAATRSWWRDQSEGATPRQVGVLPDQGVMTCTIRAHRDAWATHPDSGG